MALVLPDSSVIVDHLNGRFGRTEFLKQLVERGDVLACCAVNFTEVYAGLRPAEQHKTEAFLNSLEYLAITPEIASEPDYCAAIGRRKATPSPTRRNDCSRCVSQRNTAAHR